MAVLLVAGCSRGDRALPPHGLINDAAITVYVSQVVDGVEQAVTQLLPGSSSGWIFGEEIVDYRFCTGVDLVLRDEAGAELGRIPRPLCHTLDEAIYLSQILPGVPTASPAP